MLQPEDCCCGDCRQAAITRLVSVLSNDALSTAMEFSSPINVSTTITGSIRRPANFRILGQCCPGLLWSTSFGSLGTHSYRITSSFTSKLNQEACLTFTYMWSNLNQAASLTFNSMWSNFNKEDCRNIVAQLRRWRGSQ